MNTLTALHVLPNMPAHLELGQALPVSQIWLKEAMRLKKKKLHGYLFIIIHSLNIPTESWTDNYKCIKQQ